jgi:tetratricopeptide (TPR) repeat protein
MIALVLSWILAAGQAGGLVTAPDAEARFDSVTFRGIDQVYDLRFEEAERSFQELIRMRPRHPAGHFFLAMVDWWRIMIDLEDQRYDERFLEALENVVAMCDSMLELDEDDVSAIFFKGGSLGFQGRLMFHRDDYLGAANAGRQALPLVQAAAALAPQNHDIQLGTGIYNYYADVIPDQYPMVKPLLLFIPAGDRKKGLEQLTVASEQGKFASVEASYFLMQTYYFQEKEYAKALAIARRLNARFPNNMQFHRYVGRCHAAMFDWTQAQEVFAEIAARAGRGQRGYTPLIEREAEYYLGSARMALGDLEAALGHFYRCDELSRSLDRQEPSGFMAMANLKIGNIYDAQSRREMALGQYRKVLEMKDYRGSRGQAEHYMKNPYRR